jgi:hypothetical protein
MNDTSGIPTYNNQHYAFYGWTCARCGSWVPNNTYHICYIQPLFQSTNPIAQPQGWQCPVCKNVYAPWVPRCENCHNKTEFTVKKTTA